MGAVPGDLPAGRGHRSRRLLGELPAGPGRGHSAAGADQPSARRRALGALAGLAPQAHRVSHLHAAVGTGGAPVPAPAGGRSRPRTGHRVTGVGRRGPLGRAHPRGPRSRQIRPRPGDRAPRPTAHPVGRLRGVDAGRPYGRRRGGHHRRAPAPGRRGPPAGVHGLPRRRRGRTALPRPRPPRHQLRPTGGVALRRTARGTGPAARGPRHGERLGRRPHLRHPRPQRHRQDAAGTGVRPTLRGSLRRDLAGGGRPRPHRPRESARPGAPAPGPARPADRAPGPARGPRSRADPPAPALQRVTQDQSTVDLRRGGGRRDHPAAAAGHRARRPGPDHLRQPRLAAQRPPPPHRPGGVHRPGGRVLPPQRERHRRRGRTREDRRPAGPAAARPGTRGCLPARRARHRRLPPGPGPPLAGRPVRPAGDQSQRGPCLDPLLPPGRDEGRARGTAAAAVRLPRAAGHTQLLLRGRRTAHRPAAEAPRRGTGTAARATAVSRTRPGTPRCSPARRSW
ncbi:hypothetical protein M2164_003918 [Streptomyces sp. SAI-208]|nr:hypothetical protein [Streptomyces sp. SAI-208]